MKVKLRAFILWYSPWPFYFWVKASGVYQSGTGGPQRCSEYADE
jgi:hypothetical protein